MSLVRANASNRSLIIRNRQRLHAVDRRLLARLTQTLLRDLLKRESFDLAIYLVGAAEITRLNEEFLRHRGSTDVITFDYCDPADLTSLSGEIFVCLDEAIRQARRFRTSWQSELVRYVVHGILHLCGYDDQEPLARRRMKRTEDRLVKQLATRFEFQRLG